LGDDIRKDYQRARMAEEVEEGDVDVVDLADLPYAPVLTASAVKLVLGLVLGLLLGLMLATSSRRSTPRSGGLRTGSRAAPTGAGGDPAHHQRLVRGTLALPRAAGRRKPRVDAGSPMSGTQTFSIGIEAFRNLRTSLIWSDGARR